MKTKTINLYSFNELSKEAQEKARAEWASKNDYPFLNEWMTERLKDLLAEHKIKSDDMKVYYSLSYCQGDGAMFTGEFIWKKYTIFITHSGHYHHSNSKSIEIHETNNLGIDIGDDYEPKVYADFEKIYQKICKELERYGYDLIETEDSMENFKEMCDANDYFFTMDGVMEN